MNVTNCRGCGRLFNQLNNEKLCPACVKELEDKFQEVKEYLNEHPNASMNEVSKENDVSTKQIKQWVREERLVFAEGSLDGIECEKCGKLIKTGRYCDECKANLTNTLMSAIDKPKVEAPKKKERTKERMRFLDN
ncbi:MAG: FeoC-like transcriptional regulator [Agathobacter sp.]|uniref:flagellar protein n=1 Tax=Agathobacter sp. TaxID=2021311 RepID=UPI00258A848E|nr:flagellar protein [Agathobacter sp.]MCR5677752.1 FeoC-like transcriptional regulator [Agathobacter sp.]